MMKPLDLEPKDVKVLIELYELPHLFGFWVSDPVFDKWMEEKNDGPWVPRGLLFLGHANLEQLDLDEDDEEPGRIATYFTDYAYEHIDAELVVQRLFLTDDGERVKDDGIAHVPWAITNDGRLNLDVEKNGNWWRYVPASVEDLVSKGFNREAIEHMISIFRDEGAEVIELFDLEKARELIAEARRKEEEENGFGPDNPFEQ